MLSVWKVGADPLCMCDMFFLDRITIGFPKLSLSLLLGIALFFPLNLFGSEQPIQQTQPPDVFNSIDAERDNISGKLISFASDIDRFFGDERHYQESNQSVFQIDVARVIGYGGNSNALISGRAKLNLPSTEKRLHLLLETNPDTNITGESTPGQPELLNHVVTPESYAVTTRYERSKENVWNISTDAGVKFQSGLTPFARARGSYSISMDQWRLKTTESMFWFNTIGAGETSQVDLERLISKSVMFRSSSIATWLIDKQNFDLFQGFSVYHTLNERTALLYQLSVIGVSNPQFQATDYALQMLYRYRLHRKWIYYELTPQLHFPKERNYQASPALSMRLEILFDESK